MLPAQQLSTAILDCCTSDSGKLQMQMCTVTCRGSHVEHSFTGAKQPDCCIVEAALLNHPEFIEKLFRKETMAAQIIFSCHIPALLALQIQDTA